jgi:putative transposase
VIDKKFSGYKHHKLRHIDAVLESGRPYHYRIEEAIILTCVRWYLAYPLSYRSLEEMMAERGVTIDHASIYRWVQKFTPKLEAAFRKEWKRPVSKSWRMDESVLQLSCIKDEGRPLEAAIQEEISNHHRRH